MYRILTDEDISRILGIESVVKIIEQTLRAKAEGALIAPPRFSIDVEAGGLVFTAGAETKYSRSIGFRVYDTFPNQSRDRPQLVAVFDSQTGGFRGLVLGGFIGALRTAAINAVAIKHMARSDAKNAGILGSGYQGQTSCAGCNGSPAISTRKGLQSHCKPSRELCCRNERRNRHSG